MNPFAIYPSPSTYFIVKNVSPQNKTIKIFNCPIVMNGTRDLMKIRGIGQNDIATSLLQGEIRFKLLVQDIVIVDSDISILQFDNQQLQFLKSNGITNGINISASQQQYSYMTNVILSGLTDGYNTTFEIPNDGYFNNTVSSNYNIVVYWNSIKQLINSDYTIIEKYGTGTGFNTILLVVPPDNGDTISADYYIENQ